MTHIGHLFQRQKIVLKCNLCFPLSTYLPVSMTDSLPSDKWIPARLKESVSLRQADSRLLFWQFGGSAISQTGPVNPSHPHRIHLIALSQFLSEVRNGVSPSQERELLNGRNTEKKKFNLCQRMSEAFTFLSTICFWPFKLRNFNSKLK